MKNPLHYQLSEYDCGPTSVLNAISYLFPREEITPEIIRNVMLYCLDCYSVEGIPGKRGTSQAAMMFLSHWLNRYGEIGQLSISSKYLSGKNVFLGPESYINDALKRRGAAVVRLFYDEPHYVLLTGIQNKNVLMFDPYYREDEFEQRDIIVTNEQPFWYNRVVPKKYFNKESLGLYAFGPEKEREALLIFNEKTELTSEKTIEYFI